MNAIAQIQTTELHSVDPVVMTPMSMIEKALSSGATPETLEKLLTLQERWEANQARKAFIASMALARAKFGPILKTNDGYLSRYKYETLTDVMDAVDGPLGEFGFSYDWVTEDLPNGLIRVTCVLTHEAGHSRSNSLSGDPKDTADAKANMNGFQRMGGAVTYLQRYTLKAALGIAASKDTDGDLRDKINEGSSTINSDEFIYIRDLIESSQAVEKKVLASVNAPSLELMTQKQYREAVSKLQAWIKAEAQNATAK
jgi:ERF superfamily